MATAADVKATGIKREGAENGKDYRLEFGGVYWIVQKQGNRWFTEDGSRSGKTVKDLKAQLVERVENPPQEADVALKPVLPGDAPAWVLERDKRAQEEEVPILTDPDTWDCIHPCALLIICRVPMGSEILRTLDAYGYLTADGVPDVEGALREYNLKYERQVLDAVESLTTKPEEANTITN